MRFILFIEGQTEEALPGFLKRWLDPRLPSRVGIKTICFKGLHKYYSGIKSQVDLNLASNSRKEIIAAIGLIDLYGPTFYPSGVTEPAGRYTWAKKHLEQRVGHPKFRQHFAVHETEAWLLADPEALPREIRNTLPAKISRPEAINFNEPPASLLNRVYRERLGKGYRKTIDGPNLFQSLSPDRAYEKCPALKALLDDMLSLAQQALR
ncbi:MAG: hypothetical protein DMF53_00900 [Acidobacteria bacterium]|nr:MAG: hypothetical protein DMF53_00900 [Acidobacteriota bacterium]